jgi:FkbM family methyltransferase
VTESLSAGDIEIDAQSGRIAGAAAHERLALTLLRTAMRILQPFHQFGFSYVARAVRSLLPSRRAMVFRLGPDSQMRVPYCDSYWSIMLLPGYQYERSVRALLVASHDVACGFIDGGANHGFWSIVASSREAGSRKVVAVEAASDTFARLDDNRLLNSSRFEALNKAIGATSNQRVRVYGSKHEARSIVAPDDGSEPILDCETITVDDIAALPNFAGLDKFIVKLDVEGMEIEAFSGAKRLLDIDTAFIYEEHGSDFDHSTTRHALDVLGLRVFWLGGSQAMEITSPQQLQPIKRSRRFGYDMVASRSPFWIDRLEKLAAGQRREADTSIQSDEAKR